ncbi:hypothetical protein [uncultured Acetobacteroides sp.]|uniref:hypothetical protein n=1 Tax=uncultured Acetobacteroides sp. TaxID=1760811 RepID=UPI0029F4AA02|nr:hypothetical protein [uncultured Acetobacteroides sp.]
MEIGEIRKAIGEWSKARTSSDDVLTYLKQGTCFKIEKSNYNLWKTKSPKELHVYLGVFNGQLQFVLIDSESDKDPAVNIGSIVVQDYYPGLNVQDAGLIDHATDGSIKVVDALKRVMKWTMFMESWVKDCVKSDAGVFQAFVIPFSDLSSQFEAAGSHETLVVFGLNGKNADLMLWGMPSNAGGSGVRAMASAIDDGDVGYPVEDLSTPCPPFHNSGLGLL